MVRSVTVALALLTAFAAPLAAQAPAPETAPAPDQTVTEPPAPEAPPPAAPRTMVGSWEFSNADREKICTVTFRNDQIKVGKRVEFDAACAGNFPFIRDIAAWQFNPNDFLRLLDAKGTPVLEFSEVESGIFEAPRPGEGILFIQNPTDLGPAPKTADQITGEWSVIRRTGRTICSLTLSNTAAGEEFVVRVTPPCDPVVARFGPATWQMDRGEIVLRSATNQSWRFEETDGGKWQRIPQTANPILMVRK
jgi:hypothetical protein